MKILFITYHFPPYNQIGAVRIGKMAKYFREFGHEVKVVTARDPFIPKGLPLEVPTDDVIYTNWWDINRIGRGTVQPTGQGESRGSPGWLVRGVSFSQRIYAALFNIPDERVGWIPYAVKSAASIAKDWHPDIVVSSGPPHSAHVVASIVRRVAGRVPWVADMRDPWVDNQTYPHPAWRKRFDKILERLILGQATGLVAVSEPWSEQLKSKFSTRMAVVTNGFEPSDYPEPETYSEKILRIVYTGTIYEGIQDAGVLFQALGLLGDAANKIRIDYYGRDGGHMLEIARAWGQEELVHINGQVTYEESLRKQVSADVLLLLGVIDPLQKGWYPAKVFEYLGAKRPILSIGPSGDVTSDLIKNAQAGAVLYESNAVAAQLDAWVKQKMAGGIPSLPPNVGKGLTRRELAASMESFLFTCVE